ncbi:MAG: low-complexity tail membrane protein [Spirulinaceae cyanobacterium]
MRSFRSFRSEPFLWIHLSGIAVLPLFLQVVWLGLAVGDPVLPFWLEFLPIAALGILPVLWMQWHRPFDIFSILILALRSEELTSEQLKILSLFKTTKHRLLAVMTAVFLFWLLWKIYLVAPAVAMVAPFPPQWRIAGLLLAALAFLASNLFLQIPVSVLGVLITNKEQFEQQEPWDRNVITQDFVIPGFRVKQILPIATTENEEEQAEESSNPV